MIRLVKKVISHSPLISSSPFKGEAGRGMGLCGRSQSTHPHPDPPLEGEGIHKLALMSVQGKRRFGARSRHGFLDGKQTDP
jgi:hypothetical protein